MTSPPEEKIKTAAAALTERVAGRIGTHPGDRAVLRRALRRRPDHILTQRAHALVAPFVPDGADEATEWAFYAVASMIAAQPRIARDESNSDDDVDVVAGESAGQFEAPLASTEDPEARGDADSASPRMRNLGVSLAEAVAAGKQKPDTTEARLHLLCRQGLDGVHKQLPRLVVQLRADLVPIDWPVLLRDLAMWGRARDQVAKRWLQDYYRTHSRLTAAKNAAARNNNEDKSEDQ